MNVPHPKPDPGHAWADDKPQTRCVRCGAYKHLGSGYEPCRHPETEEAMAAEANTPVWAVVELMGHLKMAGRLTEEERFGANLGRLDIPNGEGGYATTYFGGGSVYRVTLVSEEAARLVALKNQPEPVRPWELPSREEPRRLPAPRSIPGTDHGYQPDRRGGDVGGNASGPGGDPWDDDDLKEMLDAGTDREVPPGEGPP